MENHPWVFENAETALEQMPIDWVFMLASPTAISNYKVVPPRWHSVGANNSDVTLDFVGDISRDFMGL